MQLTQKNLDDFKKIYKKNFNVDLIDKEALEKATSLLTLMKILLSNQTN
jgi:hypothetical protein